MASLFRLEYHGPGLASGFTVSISKLVIIAVYILASLHLCNSVNKRRQGAQWAILVPRTLSMEHCQDGRPHALLVHNYTSVVDGRGRLFLITFMEFQRVGKVISMVDCSYGSCHGGSHERHGNFTVGLHSVNDRDLAQGKPQPLPTTVKVLQAHIGGMQLVDVMKITLHRCCEAVSSNTCEYFATWPLKGNLCAMVGTKGMMWSNFFASFQPPLKCPIKAGLYKVENATLELSLGETISNINIAGNVWYMEVVVLDEPNVIFSCLRTSIMVNRVKVAKPVTPRCGLAYT